MRKDINNYYQNFTGNTERYISVKPVKIEGAPIFSKQLLKSYKFSNFWKGMRPIRRLIKKIFEEKLNTQMVWKSDIWDKTIVVPIKCTIKDLKREQYFNELKPKSINEISENFAKNISKKRKKSIEKLAMKIRNKIDLGNPFYISGSILNYLGAVVDWNEIFMIDGARRIVASALNHQKYIKVLLLMLKDEYAKINILSN